MALLVIYYFLKLVDYLHSSINKKEIDIKEFFKLWLYNNRKDLSIGLL